MGVVPPDYELLPWQRPGPVIWVAAPRQVARLPDCSDEVMEKVFGPGENRLIRTWGHDPEDAPYGNVHWLATRAGTGMHHDIGWTRYTHQLNVRNDGFRTGGFDEQDDLPELGPTVMACLDTWSPHKVRQDDRIIGRNNGAKPKYKVQLVMDLDKPLSPDEVWERLSPFLSAVTCIDRLDIAPPEFKPKGYHKVDTATVKKMPVIDEMRLRAYTGT